MTTIPEPAAEPDPIESNDWLGQNVGESIVGTVVERETFTSKRYNRDFDVLTIRNGDGDEKRVPCARAHLAQLLAEHDPQPGDGIAITYFGERPDGYGFQYAMRVSKQEEVDDHGTPIKF